MAKRRKIVLAPVVTETPEAIAELEKEGVFTGPLSEAELKAKREAWEATLRWPLRGVVTEEFAALPEDERMYQMALGNIQSAKSLCIELGEHPERLSWPRGSVVYYLSHLAVELFLKACLLRKGRRFATHEISELQDAFAEVFPGRKGIQTMWDINIVELAELGPEPGDRRIRAREDEKFRYFADRQGNPPRGEGSFAPAVLIPAIERLEKDFVDVWGSLSS
jgi:HEPN domain-containing protein